MTSRHQQQSTDTRRADLAKPARRDTPRGPVAPDAPAKHDEAPQIANMPTATSLSTSKVLAGGMAAATSAVLGSYFGAFGTVGGAAAGSVATAVSTTVYQRSIERTRNSLRARVTANAYGPTARGHLQRRQAHGPQPVARHRHLPRALLATIVTGVAIFALGLGAVTGVELVHGAPLSGGSHGTSVGRVLGVSSASPVVPPAGSHHSAHRRPGTHSEPPSDSGPTEHSRQPQKPGELGGVLPNPPGQPQNPGGLGGVLPNQSGQSQHPGGGLGGLLPNQGLGGAPSGGSNQPGHPQAPGAVPGGLLPGPSNLGPPPGSDGSNG